VRSFLLAAVLGVGTTASAAGQLAVQQPTEKLLIVPVPVTGGADSLTSLRITDLTRERLDKLARYKVVVIPKQKICEALGASGFSCDGLMDRQQASQLARFLDADAYVSGVIARDGSALSARLRVIDIGGSGFAYSFSARDGNPGSPEALAEAIAQRLNTIIRAAERTRECEDQRRKGQFPRATESARKALENDPNLPAAHLCIATIYEAQRLRPDSLIAAAGRALKGDSLNTHALDLIFRQHQVKGDTAVALDWAERLYRADPSNKNLLLGIVTQRQLRREYERAAALLREGLQQFPGDPQLHDRLYQVCIEGGRWRCVLEVVNERVLRDSTLLGDTATLAVAIGAAQAAPDTQALDRWSAEAAKRYPNNVSYLKIRATAHEWHHRPDSAVATLQRVLALQPTETAAALAAAKIVVERASYDTAGVRGDSTMLPARRAALADQLEKARPLLARGRESADTGVRLNAAVLMLTAGSKLAQAQAYDRAYPWLDTLLLFVAPRGPADTTGPRHQIRVQASFWWGIASVVTSQPAYRQLTQVSKSCPEAKIFNDRIQRTRAALELSRRVHPQTVERMLGAVAQYENAMKSVRDAFKCRNF
jgi:tetratricopeptide (TPR) repeat protein